MPRLPARDAVGVGGPRQAIDVRVALAEPARARSRAAALAAAATLAAGWLCWDCTASVANADGSACVLGCRSASSAARPVAAAGTDAGSSCRSRIQLPISASATAADAASASTVLYSAVALSAAVSDRSAMLPSPPCWRRAAVAAVLDIVL